MKSRLILLLAFAVVELGFSQSIPLQFAPIFSDSMVLQQKTAAALWGKGRPGGKISIEASWKGAASAVADSDGNWSATIKTPSAGGPFTLRATDGNTAVTLSDILVGEVWLCSGQSNMEMPLEGWRPANPIMNSDSEIANAKYPQIRLFGMHRAFSTTPQYACDGKWTECTPLYARSFSATGYFFGRKLHRDLKVPIGLIHVSWGGTMIESWMNRQDLMQFADYVPFLDRIEKAKDSIAAVDKWVTSHPTLKVKGELPETRWKGLEFNDSACAGRDFNDSLWKTMQLPQYWEGTEVGDFDGTVWFRKRVELPKTWRGKNLILSIGPVDDMDQTYVNGELVGSNLVEGVYALPRIYPVANLTVNDSVVEVAVKVIDYGGGGGLWGKPEDLQLRRADTALSISLAGSWKYLPVAEYRGGVFYLFGWKGEEFFKRPKSPIDFSGYSPTALFNGMISPVIPFTLRGVIWYQGESNVGHPEMYAKLFPMMIHEWRSAFRNPDMPFYFVQIAPYDYGEKTHSEFLREAQLKTLSVSNTGMAVIMDVGNPNNIHPADKQDVGERLARWALAKTYHEKKIVYSGPVYRSMKVKKNIIILSFDEAGKRLVLKGNPDSSGFQIAGEDRQFRNAVVVVKGATLVVSSPGIEHPAAVRYAFSNTPEATLFNDAGLPASSFRTDSWDK